MFILLKRRLKTRSFQSQEKDNNFFHMKKFNITLHLDLKEKIQSSISNKEKEIMSKVILITTQASETVCHTEVSQIQFQFLGSANLQF